MSAGTMKDEGRDVAGDAASIRAATERTRRYLEQLEAELEQVQRKLTLLASEGAPDSVEYVSVEERNTKLANLYVSCARLDRAEDRAEVLVAIQEIVINVIGSEELILFAVDGEAPYPLGVLTSFGMDRARVESVAAGHGAVGRAARGEACRTREDAAIASEEAGLTTCVPVTVDGVVTAVLAIFQSR